MPESHAERRRVPRAWKRRGPRPTRPGSAPHGPAASRRAGQTPEPPPTLPNRCFQSATRSGTRSVNVAVGQLLSRERQKATVLAERRPPASLTDFQRRPSFTRFAWCWRGSCHCPPMDFYDDLQPSLRCRPSPSHLQMDMRSDCCYQEKSLPVSPPPAAFVLPSGHQQVPQVRV